MDIFLQSKRSDGVVEFDAQLLCKHSPAIKTMCEDSLNDSSIIDIDCAVSKRVFDEIKKWCECPLMWDHTCNGDWWIMMSVLNVAHYLQMNELCDKLYNYIGGQLMPQMKKYDLLALMGWFAPSGVDSPIAEEQWYKHSSMYLLQDKNRYTQAKPCLDDSLRPGPVSNVILPNILQHASFMTLMRLHKLRFPVWLCEMKSRWLSMSVKANYNQVSIEIENTDCKFTCKTSELKDKRLIVLQFTAIMSFVNELHVEIVDHPKLQWAYDREYRWFYEQLLTNEITTESVGNFSQRHNWTHFFSTRTEPAIIREALYARNKVVMMDNRSPSASATKLPLQVCHLNKVGTNRDITTSSTNHLMYAIAEVSDGMRELYLKFDSRVMYGEWKMWMDSLRCSNTLETFHVENIRTTFQFYTAHMWKRFTALHTLDIDGKLTCNDVLPSVKKVKLSQGRDFNELRKVFPNATDIRPLFYITKPAIFNNMYVELDDDLFISIDAWLQVPIVEPITVTFDESHYEEYDDLFYEDLEVRISKGSYAGVHVRTKWLSYEKKEDDKIHTAHIKIECTSMDDQEDVWISLVSVSFEKRGIKVVLNRVFDD